jgi:hypothetical protein
VILIYFLLIFTESEAFQQMGQTISQGDSDSTENHFLRETEIFLIYSESGTVPSTPLRSKSIFLWMFEDKITNSQGQIKIVPP